MDSLGKSCFFIGHRDAGPEVYPALVRVVEAHICQLGVQHFFVGHYGGFDRLAARAVLAAQLRDPGVGLWLLLPYHPAEQPVEAPIGFSGSYYPPDMEGIPRRLAILQANRYMAAHVGYMIAYVRHPASNAAKLLDYARKLETPPCITRL